MNFQDHSEILLNSESRLVTYVDKKGDRQTLPLNMALESNNAEMTKRLKYTKDILTHMLNNGKPGGGTQNMITGGTGMSSSNRNTNLNTASSRRSVAMNSETSGLPSAIS